MGDFYSCDIASAVERDGVTIKRAAEMLGTDAPTVKKMIALGHLDTMRAGMYRFVRKKSIERVLENRKRAAGSE